MNIKHTKTDQKISANWEKAKLNFNSTIEDAIKSLVTSSLRIVLIVDTSNNFLGTVTDGDIRRGILKGFGLNSPISHVMNSDALVVNEEISEEAVLQLMNANKILQIPIVNSQKNICGLYSWDEINLITSRPNLMIIMAGGKGTRLMPYTKDLPKPMVAINKKPMLQHLIEKACREGFKNFLLIIHHLGHVIQDYFGNGNKFGINIEYLIEDEPMGTVGGLGMIEKIITEPFVVTNADVISDVNYGYMIDFHKRNLADATMAVRSFEWQNPYGVVDLKGIDILNFNEKPIIKNHINAGIYVLSPLTLAQLKKGMKLDMPDFLMHLKNENYKVIAYPIHESWMDLGRPVDLSLANNILNNH
jgi:dTDP-glucose pyrophosphorylase